jgi:hypothetical protein
VRIPVIDKSGRNDGAFACSDFSCDPAATAQNLRKLAKLIPLPSPATD